jgi:hypothetical protein
MGGAFVSGVLVRLPDYLTAIATGALAVIAGLQVIREVSDGRRRRAATKRRLTGVAWLARRSCEVTLHRGVGGTWYRGPEEMAAQLAQWFTEGRSLDRLERHFREALALSSALGSDDGTLGARAFEGFIAAADRYNAINSHSADRTEWEQLSDEALRFLYAAVDDLQELAERRAFELPLPDVRTLGYNREPPPLPLGYDRGPPPLPGG